MDLFASYLEGSFFSHSVQRLVVCILISRQPEESRRRVVRSSLMAAEARVYVELLNELIPTAGCRPTAQR